jgi:peroxiredoxin Q/BCP
MKMKTKHLLILTSAFLLFSTAGFSADLKLGDDAPNFKLPGSDGKTYELSSFKGKQAVVISWFPKAFTGGCTAECKSLRENSAKIREFDVAYFTASVDPMDGEKGNKAFAESLDLNYPILSDESKATAESFGVVTPQRAVPFRWTFYIGKDGKILFIDKEVNTGSHGTDIAAKLTELGVAKKK